MSHIHQSLNEAVREKHFWKQKKQRTYMQLHPRLHLREGAFVNTWQDRELKPSEFQYSLITQEDITQDKRGLLYVHGDQIIRMPAIRLHSGDQSPLVVDCLGKAGLYRLIMASECTELLYPNPRITSFWEMLQKAEVAYAKLKSNDEKSNMAFDTSARNALPMPDLDKAEAMRCNNPIRIRAVYLVSAMKRLDTLVKEEKVFCCRDLYAAMEQLTGKLLKELDCLDVMCRTSEAVKSERFGFRGFIAPAALLLKQKLIVNAECLLSTQFAPLWAPSLWLVKLKSGESALVFAETTKLRRKLVALSDSESTGLQNLRYFNDPRSWLDMEDDLLNAEMQIPSNARIIFNGQQIEFVQAQNFEEWETMVTQTFISNNVAFFRRMTDDRLESNFPLAGY